MTQHVAIQIGDQLFDGEEGSAFGAVVGIHEHELLVEMGAQPRQLVGIAGGGQRVLPGAAIRAVHDGKLIGDLMQLPAALRASIEHAHDRETQ